jgi:hypothetical protein
MATYPAYKQAYDSRPPLASGLKTERAGNGSLWIRKTYTSFKRDFEVVHPSLTKAEYDALITFYNANVGIAFDFTWNGDGVTYTGCYFTDVPQIDGQTSTRNYRVRVKISQA